MADSPKGTRVSGDARTSMGADLAERYKQGESIRDLASDVGRSYGFVHRLLVEQGVPLRSRGGSAPSRRRSSE